jgi:alkaline ceramidase
MSTIIPCMWVFADEAKMINCSNQRLKSLRKRSLWLFIVGVILWIDDRIFCNFYLSINFPYLHAIFHILACTATYSAVIMGMYYYVAYDYPQFSPRLKYWPSDNFEYGMPYVELYKPTSGSFVDLEDVKF